MIFTAMTKLISLTHLILNNITITEEVREEILTVLTNNTELQHIEISGHLKRSYPVVFWLLLKTISILFLKRLLQQVSNYIILCI